MMATKMSKKIKAEPGQAVFVGNHQTFHFAPNNSIKQLQQLRALKI
jgi:hypothetical protein